MKVSTQPPYQVVQAYAEANKLSFLTVAAQMRAYEQYCKAAPKLN